MDEMEPSTHSSHSLRLPFSKGRQWVALHQIVRLEGIGNYTTLVFADGSRLLVSLHLKRLQERLPAESFLRLHRKHIVNRLHLTSMLTAQQNVLLSNGERLKIARRRMVEIKQQLRIVKPF